MPAAIGLPWRAFRRVKAAAPGARAIEAVFDATAYRVLNPDLPPALDDPLAHFLEHGVGELRPCSFDHGFSPAFYKAYYPRFDGFSEAEAYRDWLNLGWNEGRIGSEAALMRRLGFTSDRIPETFSAATYRAEHSDLQSLSDPQAFEHFVRYGCREGRRPPLAGEAGAVLLRKLADLYALANEPGIASWCLDQALALNPADAAALQSYGDLQLNAGLSFLAGSLYAAADVALPDQLWTLVNQGVASERSGDLGRAVACYRRAAAAHPGQAFVRARLRATASTRFHLSWGRSNQVANDDPVGARKMLREAVADYIAAVGGAESPAPPLRRRDGRPLRVAILASDVIPQCLHYRVLQKVEHLQAAGVDANWWPYGQADAFRGALHGFDVAIFYRVPATPDVMDAVLHARRLGLATVFEIDDLIFDEANYPPPLESFGGLVSAAEFPGLVTGATLFTEMMRLCDYGLTSTPPLQDAIAAVVRERRCLLHRNGMGEAHHRVADGPQANASRPSGQVTAFFGSGSRSHNENFDAFAAPALAAVMARRPELRLKVMGHLTLGPELQPFANRIQQVPFTTDTVGYWRELAYADINLAPLTPSLFNDCKSEIKWLEAAMAGVPSLVSGSRVYREALQDGEDVCLANDVAQWTEQLDRLVGDAELRRRIGAAARERALRDYGRAAMAENARTVMETVWRLHRRGPPARRKPRLLFVNVYYAPQTIGGATRVVEDNVRELHVRYGRDFELEVFCAREGGAVPGELERYSWNGVGVTAMTPCPADGAAPETSAGNAQVFREYLQACRPDLIHFHAMQTLTASLLDEARGAGVPYVVTPHDGWWISDHQFLLDGNGRPVPESGAWGDPVRRQRLLTALNGAEAVLAVSRSFGALLRERGVAKVVDCFNGVAVMGAVPPPPPGPKVRLGLLGGLGVAKGADLLRRALSNTSFPNLTFVVVDHLAPPFSRRLEAWGPNTVEILGKTPQAEVARLYGELNVLLAPSICVESFGLVAREALVHGRWVVASDRGAIGDEVAVGENGWLVDVSDPAALINVLREVNGNPARYLQPARAPMTLRTSADQADDLAALYNRLLDRGLERAAAARSLVAEAPAEQLRVSAG